MQGSTCNGLGLGLALSSEIAWSDNMYYDGGGGYNVQYAEKT